MTYSVHTGVRYIGAFKYIEHCDNMTHSTVTCNTDLSIPIKPVHCESIEP